MDKTISILGCGWLGLPLAKHLMEAGYRIKGSTTTQSKLKTLKEEGIDPYLILLKPELQDNFSDVFLDADILIINIPPGTHRHPDGSFHIQQISSLIQHINKSLITSVIFISSTSVYPELNRVVTERDTAGLPRDQSHPLLIAEDLLKSEKNHFDTTIVRFGGLYGYDRHPARFLAGKTNLTNGSAPVNMIHRDDCINIISLIIEKDIHNQIFNACSDEHPTRREYYTNMADRLNLPAPSFLEESTVSFKIVSNEKLKQTLGYQFLYPSPFEGPLLEKQNQ